MIRWLLAFVIGATLVVAVGLKTAENKDIQQRQTAARAQVTQGLDKIAQYTLTSSTADLPSDSELSFFVLKRSKYLAHSESAKANTSLDRESIQDKALYDTAEAMRRAYKKTKTPETVWLESEYTLSARRIMVRDERAQGMAQVTVPLNPSTGPPLTPITWLFLAIAVFVVGALRVPWLSHRALGVAAIAALAGVLAVSYGSSPALGVATVAALTLFLATCSGWAERAQDALTNYRRAYLYMLPAGAALGLLVALPVLYGIGLGLHEKQGSEYVFVGLRNYIDILSNLSLSDPQSFYYKLAVTVAWTLVNVVLHLGIGLFFALLLNDPLLKARGLFRVLLIVPWAVPNYITALIWKGMFHKQFGAVNAFLAVGGAEPISWFQSFETAFFANVATNTWLGFPFMMVVSLGALASIPSDLYEAAVVDGASRWQRFSRVTLPLLMPALVPAVIVGAVWTFNMFNIIYLVSEGQPQGSTDILVTDAFRWAFERDRYGYAAAYSTLIFAILLGFGAVTNRLTKASKGAFE